jgi:hypothetical protein
MRSVRPKAELQATSASMLQDPLNVKVVLPEEPEETNYYPYFTCKDCCHYVCYFDIIDKEDWQ